MTYVELIIKIYGIWEDTGVAGIDLEKVRVFIQERKCTEQDFATAMGISYSYLYRVLRGERQGGVKFIAGLIKAGMNPKEIFAASALTIGNGGVD